MLGGLFNDLRWEVVVELIVDLCSFSPIMYMLNIQLSRGEGSSLFKRSFIKNRHTIPNSKSKNAALIAENQPFDGFDLTTSWVEPTTCRTRDQPSNYFITWLLYNVCRVYHNIILYWPKTSAMDEYLDTCLTTVVFNSSKYMCTPI